MTPHDSNPASAFKHYRTRSGIDLVVNGAFAADSDWTKGTGWTIGGGNASSDGTQGGDADLTAIVPPLLALKRFAVTMVVSSFVAGKVTPVAGAVEGTDRAADGTFIESIISDGTGLHIQADLDFIGNVDDVKAILDAEADAQVATDKRNVFGCFGRNNNGATRYIQLFDLAAPAADGDVPMLQKEVAADEDFDFPGLRENGIHFANGIYIVVSETEGFLTIGDATADFHVLYS